MLAYSASVSAENVRVAAAASLSHVLKEIADKYHQESGESVALSFGSSAVLTRQIIHGAPYHVFLSANRSYAQMIVDKGLGLESAVYAQGRLVLYVPNGSVIALDPDLMSVENLLNQGGLNRFAIANPQLAPYGQLAQQVLTRRKLWARIRPYLVIGENAAQAAQFATAGSVDAALLPLSLAQLPALLEKGQFVELPAALTGPLDQFAVLLKNTSPAAHRFFRFLLSQSATAVYLRHGYTIPAGASLNDEY